MLAWRIRFWKCLYFVCFALLYFLPEFESFRFYIQVLNLFPVDLFFFFNKVRDIDLVSFFCIWILSIMCIICWRGCNFSSVCFWQVCPKLDISDYATSLLLVFLFYSVFLPIFSQCHDAISFLKNYGWAIQIEITYS